MLPEIPDYPATVAYCRCGDRFTGFDCAVCRAAFVSLQTVGSFVYAEYEYRVPDGEPF